MIGDDEIAAAVAHIRRHVQHGLAPSVQWYEATCGSAGVRSLGYMRRHYGLTYVDMVLRAGAQPRGGLQRSLAARRARPQRRIGVPDEVEDQVEQEERHRNGWQDPHGRTWLHCSDGWYSPTLPTCTPRRQEIGRYSQPDGTTVVTYRYFYPLK